MTRVEAGAEPGADRFAKPDSYFESDRREVLALLPADARRILDVGCGAAESWRGCGREVHGIERDPAAAERARAHLASVVCADLTRLELPFERESFDVIVFADVLEHLYDPWGTLSNLQPWLKRGGRILVSLPNVRYYKVLRRLILHADFAYERSGVLDIDHVRFFARRNVEQMLDRAGFDVETWRDVRRGSLKYRLLNRLCLGALRDFLARQYVILARRRD